MYNSHNQLNEFYDLHVKLDNGSKTNLASYRDTNLERVKNGLKKLGEEKNTIYPSYSYSRNQGSHAMNTMNQNEENDYDIDVALVFEKDNLPSSSRMAPVRIADAILKAGGNFTKDPEPRTNAVTVWYADGYHVDFAIYRTFVDYNGNSVIEHAGADWVSRDPMAITNWFNEKVKELSPSSNDSTVLESQLRRIVQFLKWFAKSRPSWSLPGGLIISALAVECYYPDRFRDDSSLYQTMINIRNRLVSNIQVDNPVERCLKLTNKPIYENQVKRLKDKLNWVIPKLDRHLSNSCTENEATQAWNKVFNHDFWGEVEVSSKQIAEQQNFGNFKITAYLSNKKEGYRQCEYKRG